MQTKQCRKCRQELELSNFTPANIGQYGVNSTCKACQYGKAIKCTEAKKEPVKRSNKGVSQKVKSGKIRGFDEITKLKVFTRDKGSCVICGTMNNLESQPHHTYFGGRKYQIPGEDYNTEKNLVTICMSCHGEIHAGKDGLNQDYRERCENYLNNIYKN